MRSFHNIESRKGGTGAAIHPYMGWSKARGTVYYIQRRDKACWRAAPALALHSDEPPYFYARTLAEVSAKLEQF